MTDKLPPVIDCQSVSFQYTDGSQCTPVLKGVDLQVYPGERVAIIGRSGSGKTSLMNCLGGLDKPTSGSVFWQGQPIEQLTGKRLDAARHAFMGFIFQFHHLLPEFTALENATLPLLMHQGTVAKATQTAKTWLEAVGLAHRLTHKPQALSGGERQRVAIARALVTQPKLILADEPTGNLDGNTATDMIELMMSLTKEAQTAFIVVTHDASLARQMDRVLELKDGVLMPA